MKLESLSPQVFYILLALALKERHGYDIMKQVKIDSSGKINLGPGTLYGAIKRMLEEKLIKESETNHSRRRYYKLTGKGKALFQNEVKRYENAVNKVKSLNLLSITYV